MRDDDYTVALIKKRLQFLGSDSDIDEGSFMRCYQPLISP